MEITAALLPETAEIAVIPETVIPEAAVPEPAISFLWKRYGGIVLAKIPGATIMEIELDRENGIYVYEGEARKRATTSTTSRSTPLPA